MIGAVPEGDTILSIAGQRRPALLWSRHRRVVTPQRAMGWTAGPRSLRGPASVGRHPRQAPLPALRQRPHHALPPADVGRWRVFERGSPGRIARPPPGTAVLTWLAGDSNRDPGGGPVQRPDPGADARHAAALGPLSAPAGPGHPCRPSSTGRDPSPPSLRRSDPARRRRAAGPANLGRHRQPVEEREPLVLPDRSLAPAQRRQRRGAGDRRPLCARPDDAARSGAAGG